jgi:LytS/YehU family sensor histidine kinase
MEMISLRKEVALLGNYLQLQKLRFGDKFEYEVLVDDAISQDEVYIPPMLSQPFIENALEHGMNHIESGGLIHVHFSMQGQALVLEIRDNGYGMQAANKQEKEHTSLAMTITKERIELMNRKSNAKVSFTVSDAYPGTERVGVKVRFMIPLPGISI